MHEYRLTETAVKPLSFTARKSLRLDDWVLCRIYKKSNHTPTHSPRLPEHDCKDTSCVEEVLASLPDIADSKSNNLPRLSSFNTGLFEEGDQYVDNFLVDANNLELNTANATNVFQRDSSTIAKIRHAGSINQMDSTFIGRTTCMSLPTGIAAKPESTEMDMGSYDLMKRGSLMMMNLPNLTHRSSFQQQKSQGYCTNGDLDSKLRFPFADGTVQITNHLGF
eukprot:c23435_g3_i2 orf=395-1060(-)